MTKAAKRLLKQVGVPTIQWSDAYGQFYARIGYRYSKSGIRQRAFHYLTKDEKVAIAKAAALKHEWREIKRKGGSKAVWPLGHAIAPAPSMARMTPQEMAAELERFHDENTKHAIETGDAHWETPNFSLVQVKDMYLAYRKGKIGLGGGEGLKESTYRNSAVDLNQALAHANAKQRIHDFGYEEIETLKDALFRRVGKGELSKRTAKNYMMALKQMLTWSHRRSEVDYRKPEDFDSLFDFRNVTTVKIEPYDSGRLKKLLKDATDREKLYVYLGLNCGYYPSDIGAIRLDEVVTYEGKPAIIRRREKTSHQNDFEALHVLWDETFALLKQEMAEENPFGRALLNAKGKPLYQDDENGKYDNISNAYGYLRKRSGVKTSFKQFRKMGASAMERIGGQQARRLYKAGAIDSGDKVYVLEAWQNLTPHLMQWGAELRKDGVLTMPTEASKP